MDQTHQGPTPPDSGPYQKDACLLFYDDATPECNPRRLRIIRALEGSPHEGFTLSCCMIVEDLTPHVSHTPDASHSKTYVMKIFDSRYSHGLRKQFGCGDFTPDRAEAVNNLDDAKLAEIHALTTQKFSVRDSQSEILQCLLELRDIEPTITRFELLELALDVTTGAGYCYPNDASIELPPLDLAYQEGFLILTQRSACRHELEMFDSVKDLSYFPKLVAAGSVCSIDAEQPQLDSPLRSFKCPAIIMSLLPGESLASLAGTDNGPLPRQVAMLPAPKVAGPPIPFEPTQDEWHIIHTRVHERAVYGLWCRGLQHTDLRPQNILITNDSNHGWDIMLVDIGALRRLKPLGAPAQGLCQSPTGPSDPSTIHSVPRSGYMNHGTEYHQLTEECLEWMIQERAPEYAKSAAFRSVSTKRFHQFAPFHKPKPILDTTIWRLLMESLFSDLTWHNPDSSRGGLQPPSAPLTPFFTVKILRYVCQLMDREKGRWNPRSVAGSWYAHAVSLITILVTSSNIVWGPEDSQLVQTKLRQCHEYCSNYVDYINPVDVPLKEIQTWASKSRLWLDSVWHESELDEHQILQILEQRFKILNDNPFPSYLEDIIRTNPELMPAFTAGPKTS